MEDHSLEAPDHLVVLVHGFMGVQSDFDHFKAIVKECYIKPDNESVLFHSVNSNSTFRKTFDGIVAGGTRVADEVEAFANQLPNIQHISFIGHSLGGIYIRWAIHLLRSRNFFEQVKPVNYVTMATPHIGIRRKSKDFFLSKAIFNYGIGMLGQTARELYLDDSDTAPLLFRMTSPEFIADLELFQRRLLYSNVYNDVMVSYRSAAIRTHNPYLPKDESAFASVSADGDLMTASGTNSMSSLSTTTGIHSPSEHATLTEYPHISRASQEVAHVQLASSEDPCVGNIRDAPFIDKAFAKDKHKNNLREMLRRLQTLTWIRFDAIFIKGLQPFAHEQIIAKNEWLHGDGESGEDVVRHVITTMIWP